MNYKITNGSVSFGADTILEEVNFEIKDKQKIAVVGRNGAGKSTLLNAIINNELFSEGIGEEKFNIMKSDVSNIGYLKQMDFEDENITMLDEILKVYKPIIDLEEKMAKTVEIMQTDKSEELAMSYLKMQQRYEFLEGFTYKKEYETAIRKFCFTEADKYKKISEFSGGQRTKIAFIKLLLSKPDILLLDEPTNHLDIVTIEWLESYLKKYPKAVVIVSHDRRFIDKIVDTIYEIEYGQITKYSGNYEFYEKQKKIDYERNLKDYEYQQKEIKRLQAIADRFRYKPTKARMAMSKLKQIERMVKIEEPNKYDLKSFRTNFTVNKQSSNRVLHAEDLEIGYNGISQAKISFDLYRGRKLGVIGANGIGKSTLLKTITEKIKKVGGKLELGTNIEIGYFDQQMESLNENKTIFDDFYTEFPNLTVTEIRNSLAAFMFYGDDVFKEISMLSGGEKVRLALCKILKTGPNLLILDEPTNHMDIVGKESLEMILKENDGTIIFVSHDRYFVNKVSDCLLVFENGKVQYYEYGYDEYIEKREQYVEEVEEKVQEKKEKGKKYNPLKEKQKLEKAIAKLENEITNLEGEKASLEQDLGKEEVYTDYVKAMEVQEKLDEIKLKIEEATNKWEELLLQNECE